MGMGAMVKAAVASWLVGCAGDVGVYQPSIASMRVERPTCLWPHDD